MAELLRPYAETRSGEPALTDEFGSTTWHELNARTDRLAGALHGLGLATGDAIAIHSGNRREYFEVMSAAGHIGLRYVLVNWHWSADELAYVLADAGVRVLFSEAAFAGIAVAAAEGSKVRGFAIGGDIPGFGSYEEFLASGPDGEPADQVMGVPMIYTSGTTGRPKGVSRKLMTAGAPIQAGKLIGDVVAGIMHIPEGGRSLLVGPVYHSAQWLYSHVLLNSGRSVVMRQTFDAAATLRLIDRHAITNVHLVPTQFVRLLRLDPQIRAGFDGASLAAVWHGAAPCSPEIKRRMIDWLGPVVHEYYGSTEAAVNTVITAEEWLTKPGSVGRPLMTTEVHVLREDGSAADPGERGQIWFRYTNGDDVAYWRDEEGRGGTARCHGNVTGTGRGSPPPGSPRCAR